MRQCRRRRCGDALARLIYRRTNTGEGDSEKPSRDSSFVAPLSAKATRRGPRENRLRRIDAGEGDSDSRQGGI